MISRIFAGKYNFVNMQAITNDKRVPGFGAIFKGS